MVGGDGLDVERFAKGEQAGAPHQVFKVRARESIRAGGEIVEIDIARQRHGFSMDAEDRPAAALVGHRDIDQLVEAAGPEQRRIDQIRSVRGRSEEHTSELQSLMRISYAV